MRALCLNTRGKRGDRDEMAILPVFARPRSGSGRSGCRGGLRCEIEVHGNHRSERDTDQGQLAPASVEIGGTVAVGRQGRGGEQPHMHVSIGDQMGAEVASGNGCAEFLADKVATGDAGSESKLVRPVQLAAWEGESIDQVDEDLEGVQLLLIERGLHLAIVQRYLLLHVIAEQLIERRNAASAVGLIVFVGIGKLVASSRGIPKIEVGALANYHADMVVRLAFHQLNHIVEGRSSGESENIAGLK